MLVLVGFQTGRLAAFLFRMFLKSSPKLLQIHGFQSKNMNMNNFDFSYGVENYGTHRYEDLSTFIQAYLYQTFACSVK